MATHTLDGGETDAQRLPVDRRTTDERRLQRVRQHDAAAVRADRDVQFLATTPELERITVRSSSPRGQALDLVLTVQWSGERLLHRVWLRVVPSERGAAYLWLEGHANAWDALVRSFACSAETLAVVDG